MRKGFTVTLLTVAVAMMGSNAMSMAPVISNIKDIVVSDDTPVTGSNLFVYPDAIDLNSVVSDGDTTDSALIWSYYEDPAGDYLINNTPPLTVGEIGVLSPTGKRIAGPQSGATDDPAAVDSNKFTITVRNKTLSPVGGPNAADPLGSGIINGMTETVVFYVSDEDQYTSQPVVLYTEDDGTDRLSPGGGTLETDQIFTASANGWQSATVLQTNGGSVQEAQTSQGLCLTVSAPGDNIANWVSPYGLINLTDNAVYEIRATMNTTQTQQDHIPFWDLGVINLDVTFAQTGANAYGANYYFLDNLGDLANTLGGSQGIGRFRSEFVVFWTPIAVSLPSWRSTSTGAFQPASDPFNNAQLSFRTFDIGSSGYGAAADFGTVCLQELKIFRHDLDSLNILTTDYTDTSLATGDVTATGNGTTYAFSGGALNISPTTPTGWQSGQLDIVPGTGTIDTQGGPQPAESWPLTWPSDVLYLITVNASIPNAGVQSTGIPDLFMIQLEGHTQTYQQDYILPNVRFNLVGSGGAGLPPVAPTTGAYKAFGYTNESSKSTFYAGLRPHISFLNITGIQPDPATGSLSIHGITVNRASF